MIYSKVFQQFKPIYIQKTSYDLQNFGNFTKYSVKDDTIDVGTVELRDMKDGVFVEMIENKNPDLYSGFGKVADQIEVEHCLLRNLKDFQIKSFAMLNSHALHFLRGKRFLGIMEPDKIQRLIKKFNTADVNQIVQNIINSTPKGQKYITDFLGSIPMVMPKSLINHYLEIIKKNPLILPH